MIHSHSEASEYEVEEEDISAFRVFPLPLKAYPPLPTSPDEVSALQPKSSTNKLPLPLYLIYEASLSTINQREIALYEFGRHIPGTE
jgi:hypothetical protein